MSVFYQDDKTQVLLGDVRAELASLPNGYIQTCVTSPPYWGLRDYGIDGQLGLESTPESYVQTMVEVFRQVRRVLKDDGTLWMNLGDSYWGSGKGLNGDGSHSSEHRQTDKQFTNKGSLKTKKGDYLALGREIGLKPKDLVGIPWRVAFALQADGWYLRSDIIWSKLNPMPESVTDRPTKAHEYLFLLSKSERYYYDAEAIFERAIYADEARYDNGLNGHGGGESHKGQGSSTRKFRTPVPTGLDTGEGAHTKLDGHYKNLPETQSNLRKTREKQRGHSRRHEGFNDRWNQMTKEEQCSGLRNKRSVWTIPTQPFPEAHFATFPPKLIEPCILAGAPDGGIVLDPFHGAGTTAMVSKQLGRKYVGIELNQAYIEMSLKRLQQECLQL